ncbi:MAG: hypothetical protein JW797_05800 [Bradymonadales bacterium]|nr:hypothetical protein [Bradymonadales bacterium]
MNRMRNREECHQPAAYQGAILVLLLGLVASCGDDVVGTTDMGDTGDATGPEYLLHVPSPDWVDQIIYFVMIDRFADGDPENNDQGADEYDPTANSHYSGGDLQGIIDRLDYIQGLGVTAIWITPPVANQWWDPLAQFSGYHGYWGRHFKQVDEHYGTLDTYRQLSDALHQRGMYLIQDIVPNHTGNFFTYDGPYDPEDPTQNVLLNSESLPVAAPEQAPFDQNDVTNSEHRAAAIYHWTPAISDYNDLTQQYTYQISDLDDLNTENPVVRQALRDSYGYWIREVGVDGFRIDTVKFVDHPFWRDFLYSTDTEAPGIDVVANATGREDFLTFGEVYETSNPLQNSAEQILSSYLGSDEDPELLAVLNFPLYEEIGRVLGEGRPTHHLAYRLEQFVSGGFYPDPREIPNFLDNHDVQRFLAGASTAAFKQSLALLMTIPGIPVIWQGTEQGFTETRASMFAQGWMSGGADHFDTTSELYTFIRDLATMRLTGPLFARGDLSVLMDTSAGPGVLVYRRMYEQEQALVVMNTADVEVLLCGLDTGLEAGTVLEVLQSLEIDEEFVVGEERTLLAELPPRAVLVLEPSEENVELPEPAAVIEVDTLLEGETFTAEVTVEGSVDPADTELVMVIDDYLATFTAVAVGTDGSFEAVIPVSRFPYGEMEHTVAFYAPEAKVASPRYRFTSDVEFEGEIITVEDPRGDDTGPEGSYTYPTDETFGHQMDILEMVIEAGPTTMNLKLRMAEWSESWRPTNGFDHVAFTIYFDVPGLEGLDYLPKINAQAPDEFAWDFTHFAFGWSNALFGTTGASETNWGNPIAGPPAISVDGPNRTITFSYNRSRFGLDSWEGVKIYVTTWDFDGIDNIYRPLTPEGGKWVFGGGEEDDPFIMDELGPVEIVSGV